MAAAADESKMCEESAKILASPLVVCKIKRSKNANVVVYRMCCLNVCICQANLTADGKSLNSEDPLEVFWLKVEPSYVKKHRDAGKMDDRTELTYLESSMAYGVSVEKSETEGEFKVTFVPLKSRPATLRMGPDGLPHCYGTNAAGKEVIVTEMFVQSKENWFGLPTVEYVELRAHDPDSGESETERVKPMG